jgi:hypothetical protein
MVACEGAALTLDFHEPWLEIGAPVEVQTAEHLYFGLIDRFSGSHVTVQVEQHLRAHALRELLKVWGEEFREALPL